MKTLKVEELTNETFREYGSFSDMLHPTGTFLGGIPARFFRDRVVANYDPTSLVAFGVNEISPREKNLIEKTEHHFNTCEVLMPMDGDLYLAVGPARKAPDYGEFSCLPHSEGYARLPASRHVPLRPLHRGRRDRTHAARPAGDDVHEGLPLLSHRRADRDREVNGFGKMFRLPAGRPISGGINHGI